MTPPKLLGDEARKPRFDFRHGVWRCCNRVRGYWVAGFGHTIPEAWRDYLNDCRRAGLA